MEEQSIAKADKATLIWLPEGQQPTADDFVQNPTPYSPEAWSAEGGLGFMTSKEATDNRPGYTPWIKVGERVLSAEQAWKLLEAWSEGRA